MLAPRSPIVSSHLALTDAAKVICWMLINKMISSKGMEEFCSQGEKKIESLNDPVIRHVAIPTSLSGGEYQSVAGVTRDGRSNAKVLFEPPTKNPSLVVMDPELTTSTPKRIWLSTGVRAVDRLRRNTVRSSFKRKGRFRG